MELIGNEILYPRLEDGARDPVESTECGRRGPSGMWAASSNCNEHPVRRGWNSTVDACYPLPGKMMVRPFVNREPPSI